MKSNILFKVFIHLFKGSYTMLTLSDLTEYDLTGSFLTGIPKILTIPRIKQKIITYSALRCQLLLCITHMTTCYSYVEEGSHTWGTLHKLPHYFKLPMKCAMIRSAERFCTKSTHHGNHITLAPLDEHIKIKGILFISRKPQLFSQTPQKKYIWK